MHVCMYVNETSWDTERNGALDNNQLRGALRTLNMRLSVTQATEVSRWEMEGYRM